MKLLAVVLAVLVPAAVAMAVVAACAAPRGGQEPVPEVVHRSVTVRQMPTAPARPTPRLLPTRGTARTVQIGL